MMRVSIILPVMDETASLRETLEILLAENRQDISEVLIIVCAKTSSAARKMAGQVSLEHAGLVSVREQQRPHLGGAMRDAFEWASGSHVVMMASDLETDPHTVKELIAAAKEGYDIVTATRWKGDGGFQGYGRIKYHANWMFQRMFGAIYATSLSDLTYGFRIFKAEWVKRIRWEEFGYAFLLETILKPLRLGANVVEIPTVWKVRPEGNSHNIFWNNLGYFRIACKTRFRPRQRLWRAV